MRRERLFVSRFSWAGHTGEGVGVLDGWFEETLEKASKGFNGMEFTNAGDVLLSVEQAEKISRSVVANKAAYTRQIQALHPLRSLTILFRADIVYKDVHCNCCSEIRPTLTITTPR